MPARLAAPCEQTAPALRVGKRKGGKRCDGLARRGQQAGREARVYGLACRMPCDAERVLASMDMRGRSPPVCLPAC